MLGHWMPARARVTMRVGGASEGGSTEGEDEQEPVGMTVEAVKELGSVACAALTDGAADSTGVGGAEGAMAVGNDAGNESAGPAEDPGAAGGGVEPDAKDPLGPRGWTRRLPTRPDPWGRAPRSSEGAQEPRGRRAPRSREEARARRSGHDERLRGARVMMTSRPSAVPGET